MFLAPGAPPTSVPSPTEQALDRVFVGFQMLENMAKDQLSQKSLLQDDQGKSIMHKKQDGREEEMKFIESFGTSVASGITSKQVIVMTKDGKFKKLGDVFQAVEYVGSLPKSWESVRWIDVQGQNYQNIAALGCELSLHPLTVDDCVETTRQKLEPFQKYLFMVLESLHHVYYFKSVDNPLRIVFTSGYVVTFHEHPLYMINCHFERTLKKLFSTAFGNSLDSFDLFHTLLSSMITTDEKAVMKIEAEVGAMEDVIYQETMKSREGFLQRMGLARRRMVQFRQLMNPKREALCNLCDRELFSSFLSPSQLVYFRDIYDSAAGMAENLSIANDILGNVESMYMGQLSMMMTESSNKVNDVMKKFSSMSTIVLPLTLVSGIWGMNMKVPFESSDSSTLKPFGILMGLMGVYITALVILFKKFNYL